MNTRSKEKNRYITKVKCGAATKISQPKKKIEIRINKQLVSTNDQKIDRNLNEKTP